MNPERPKVNNNELYQKLLIDHPPQYALGDLVLSNFGLGKISGRSFNERSGEWKYVVEQPSLPGIYWDATAIYSKVS